jgi:hypothetical protein
MHQHEKEKLLEAFEFITRMPPTFKSSKISSKQFSSFSITEA